MSTSAATSTDHVNEMTPHRKTIRDIVQVLLWSTGTPLWLRTADGYKCAYCEQRYPQPDRLKKHTLEEHDDVTEARFLRITSFSDAIVKLDITSLSCKLCREPGKVFDNLSALVEHLNGTHSKRIDEKINNNFLTFKYHSNVLHCGLCSKTFPTFKILEEHLNLHMKIYKCDTCNEVFGKKSMLQLHVNTMHRDYVPPKIVIQNKNLNTRYICHVCGETFADQYSRRIHRRKVHKVGVYHACQACDRVFGTRNALTIHTRRDHLVERNFKCKVCNKGFFSKWTMFKHELMHSNEKKYSCQVCGKAFKFSTSLPIHMKIHNGVRKFQCSICHQKFVQKASWQGHMRNKHEVIVN